MKHVILVYGPSMRYKEIQSVTSNLYLLPNLRVDNLVCVVINQKLVYTHTHTQTQTLPNLGLQTSIYCLWSVHTQARSTALVYTPYTHLC